MYIKIGTTKCGKITEITKNNQIGTTKQKILVLSHILQWKGNVYEETERNYMGT